jgi:small redox-active disulfide protein 2
MTHLIQVLGPGCVRCERLAKNAARAAADLGLECRVDKITDLDTITGFGILMTPGLVVDGEVRSTGAVLTVAELKGLLGDVNAI